MSFDDTNAVTVIVGAGPGGTETSLALREQGWAGRIVLVGDEPHLPYHRPPLSKAWLTGDATDASLNLRPAATFDKARVERLAGVRVDSIERDAHRVILSDGGELIYTKLVLATGGRSRPLPVWPATDPDDSRVPNAHTLRTLDDAQALRADLQPGSTLVVIGGGYIGLEVAASAIKLGLRVHVLESAPRLLARVTVPEISAFYESQHRAAGVVVHTNAQVTRVECDASGRARTVHCADGTQLPCDVVVIGVGQLPNIELATGAGLLLDNGIVVDDYCRTSDADIFAIGDCSNHPSALYGRRVRLESVPNALEQARCVASTLCGKNRAYNAVPWFWSDQFDLKLKTVGLSQGFDNFVLRGSLSEKSFTAFYLLGRRVLAVDSVNRPLDFSAAKRLVAESIDVDPQSLRDDSIPLKSLLPAG